MVLFHDPGPAGETLFFYADGKDHSSDKESPRIYATRARFPRGNESLANTILRSNPRALRFVQRWLVPSLLMTIAIAFSIFIVLAARSKLASLNFWNHCTQPNIEEGNMDDHEFEKFAAEELHRENIIFWRRNAAFLVVESIFATAAVAACFANDTKTALGFPLPVALGTLLTGAGFLSTASWYTISIYHIIRTIERLKTALRELPDGWWKNIHGPKGRVSTHRFATHLFCNLFLLIWFAFAVVFAKVHWS